MELWMQVTLALLCLGIGFLAGGYIIRLKHQARDSSAQAREDQLGKNLEQVRGELLALKQDMQRLQAEKELLGQELIRREAEVDHLQEKLSEQKKEILKLQDTFTKEFENLANKILEEKSTKFTEQNQKNIRNILTPLHDKIQLFEKKVEQTRKENYGIHQALKEQLMTLQNQNLKITQEAENLTRALKGESKMQGNWGNLCWNASSKNQVWRRIGNIRYSRVSDGKTGAAPFLMSSYTCRMGIR